jgi:hypothetical protein
VTTSFRQLTHLPTLVAAVAAMLCCAAPAEGVTVPAQPIPEGPEASSVPSFLGAPATPSKVDAPKVPAHPFMAANGRSNLHGDAYQTDTNTWAGPLGRNMQRLSTFQVAECASVTFDRAGRVEAVCVGLDHPRLVLLDPRTLDMLASYDLPPRIPSTGGGNPFTDFSGGGYFYLDDQDRAVLSTSTRHILVIGQTSGPLGVSFAVQRDYDVSRAVPPGDSIISALPDWKGRIWFVSAAGVVGTVDPTSGAVKSIALGEKIGNSFAVDNTGGVFIVSDGALYRFDATADGTPAVTWREAYVNTGVKKPGQTQAGSGTTPTLLGTSFVAITDNADPMDVVVYWRAKSKVRRLVCVQPVFGQGASDTDQSLIGAGRSMVVENNYGYSGLAATEQGATTTPGLERVDVNSTATGCTKVWHSDERAPSVVPKLSLASGLVYTYTKPPTSDGTDAWYFTAIDFRTGQTVYKRLAGTGLGFNNNYAPVTLGPDGSAYVGALGGLVRLFDG